MSVSCTSPHSATTASYYAQLQRQHKEDIASFNVSQQPQGSHMQTAQAVHGVTAGVSSSRVDISA